MSTHPREEENLLQAEVYILVDERRRVESVRVTRQRTEVSVAVR